MSNDVLDALAPPAVVETEDLVIALARTAASTMALEIGTTPGPRLIALVERGLRELLDAVDGAGKVKKTGPKRGQYSRKTAMRQLRDRELTGESGRRRAPLTEDLLTGGVVSTEQMAKWLGLLLVGQDSLDGEYFMSSAVWASRLPSLIGLVGVEAMPVTEEAAMEWAVAADRLLNGDPSQSRRKRVVESFRAFRNTAGRTSLSTNGGVPAISIEGPATDGDVGENGQGESRRATRG